MFTSLQLFFQKHKKEIWIILFLTLLAGSFRFYQLGPWLHFELDQARDAIVIDRALEGSFLDLPLLGPKAGGTFLRLGPLFYYLEYFSASVFGGDVMGHMIIITLLGTLLIPLFYLFLRRIYSWQWSTFGALWMTFSLYAILYSRFGWNPNLLPFFILLGFLLLLVAFDEDITQKNKNRAFVASIISLTIATQMHFLAFLGLPLIVVLFLLYKYKSVSSIEWKTWVLALFSAVFLYLPMVLNETKTQFSNTSEFFGAITEKSTKEEHPFLEKFVKNTNEYGLATVVVLTSFEGATFPRIDIEGLTVTSIICEGRCDQGKWYGLLGILFFMATFVLICIEAVKSKGKRKDFYVLIALWQAIAFVLFTPLAYGIAPRFYLLTLPVFFVGGVLALECIYFSLNRLHVQAGKVVVVVICCALVGSHLFFIERRFSELDRAIDEPLTTLPDRILKEKTRVTYEQQIAIVEAILALPKVSEVPLYFESTSQYKRAFKYLLHQKTIPTDGISPDAVYREGVYVYVLRTQSDIPTVLGRILESFDITEKRVFGTLTLIVLAPKEDAITAQRQIIVPPVATTSNTRAPKRYTWREYFGSGQGETLEEEESGENEEKE